MTDQTDKSPTSTSFLFLAGVLQKILRLEILSTARFAQCQSVAHLQARRAHHDERAEAERSYASLSNHLMQARRMEDARPSAH